MKMPFQEPDRLSKYPNAVLDCHLVFQCGAAQNSQRRLSHIHNMQNTVNIKMSPYVLNPKRLKTNVNEGRNQGSHRLRNEIGYIYPLYLILGTVYLSFNEKITTLKVKKAWVLILGVLVTDVLFSHNLLSLFGTHLFYNTSKDKGKLYSPSASSGVPISSASWEKLWSSRTVIAL